jgi:hypothetical protein
MDGRHIFLGGNTPEGFFSYYDNALNNKKDRRLFILKGGPGVGKSSFVKEIAEVFSGKGYSIEYLHCSGDGDSLDGITIPKLKVAIIDGTAPHMVDPKVPGAFDEIINLGLYLDEEKLIPYKNEIMKANETKTKLYKNAYKYLKAARIIDEDSVAAYVDCMNMKTLNEIVNHIIKRTMLVEKEGIGTIRKIFASAITPDGSVSYIDSLIEGTKIIELKGETVVSKKILEKVCEEVVVNGYDVEACYCPLYPDKIEHLIIPELKISIVSLNKYHNCKQKATMEIDVDKVIDKEALSEYCPTISKNTQMFEQLLERASEKINIAKELHKKTEKYYIDAMDFDSVTLEREVLIARIAED